MIVGLPATARRRVCFVAVCVMFVCVYSGTISWLASALSSQPSGLFVQNVVGTAVKGSSDAFKVHRQRQG